MTHFALVALLAVQVPAPEAAAAIAERVEIVRTEYGVPHILAEDLKAMGFGLGYVQSEDYGDQVAVGLVKRRGTYARYLGLDSIGGDFAARTNHARAIATFALLDAKTRDVYEGFAQGVNHYVRLHPDEFPEWLRPDFTAIDALAGDVQTWSRGDAAAFVRAEVRRSEAESADADVRRGDAGDVGDRGGGAGAGGGADVRDGAKGTAANPSAARDLPRSWQHAVDQAALFDADLDGSNAWALDGTRIDTGNPVLLRNPHLSWTAGYYEAHVRVPDVIDFYGDFRIGGAFGIVGGFNAHLGWATTNNSPRYSQVYALEKHPALAGHAMLDGAPLAIESRTVTVDYLNDNGALSTESETTRWTAIGPVIHEDAGRVYVLKDPRDGEFRRGEQFLRMMLTENLQDWLEVMRMRAHPSSNFTYADRAGNIALYYNARIPALPHESTGDSAAIATSITDVWQELAPWGSLPLYLNPPGGYVQQANDTPDYVNLNVTLGRDTVAPNLPDPRLRLRSQLSFALIHDTEVMSLEEVMELKHSPRMLAAERMVDDLIAAIVATETDDELSAARDVLEAWDRTAAADSRGGVLFKRWFEEYNRVADSTFYREAWSPENPVTTPSGVGAPGRAVTALRFVIEDMRSEGQALDARWGDVHRVVRGSVDEPVAGCEGGLGCFRTLSFETTDDGRLAANRGDGWILGVEFAEVPRGFSVLAYGQSRLESSPYFDDQAALFARGEMKRIAWTVEDIERTTTRRYRPGEETRSEGNDER